MLRLRESEFGPRGAGADGVQQVLALPVDERRRAARARAADFPWSAAVDRMLELLPAA